MQYSCCENGVSDIRSTEVQLQRFQVEVAFAKIHIRRCAINSRNRYTDYGLPFYYLHFRPFLNFRIFRFFIFIGVVSDFFHFFPQPEETKKPSVRFFGFRGIRNSDSRTKSGQPFS